MNIQNLLKTIWGSINAPQNPVLDKPEIANISNDATPFINESVDKAEEIISEKLENTGQSLNTSFTPLKSSVLKVINPIYPYFKSYGGYSTVKRLEDFNTPLSEQQYEKLFKELINLKAFTNKGWILNKIFCDMKKVNDALNPLKKLGFELTLDLTGGAVRDFILNRHDIISDLDVMVSFSENQVKIENLTAKDFSKVGFSANDISKINLDGDLGTSQTKLVQLCFEKINMVEKTFIHGQRETEDVSSHYGEIVRDRLAGVIKLKSNSTNYKIDLLVTDFIKPAFLNDFDINLCKASFSLVNKFYKKDFPKDFTHLISRFSANIEFFADIYNKKLTIDISRRSPLMLDNILEKHLPRVLQKYPDYQVNFIHYKSDNKKRLEKVKKQYLASQTKSNLD